MISRYKKPGGFLQLLALIETCGFQKQEKLLKALEEEDSHWAEAIKTKLLSLQKILAWDDSSLMTVLGAQKPLVLGTALHGFDEPTREKLLRLLPHSLKIKVGEVFGNKIPNAGEIATVQSQMVTEVRALIDSGQLDLTRIDPSLAVPKEIEESLNASAPTNNGHLSEKLSIHPSGPHLVENHSNAQSAPHSSAKEIEPYLKKIRHLETENVQLKDKLAHAEAKLSQIRKIV